MTPIICCSCQQPMGFDERPFPPPEGCTDLAPVTSGMCKACLNAKYGYLARMVLEGKATLVTKRLPV
jgi:hypothetical protein